MSDISIASRIDKQQGFTCDQRDHLDSTSRTIEKIRYWIRMYRLVGGKVPSHLVF